MIAMDLNSSERPISRFFTSTARPNGAWSRAGLAWAFDSLFVQTADGVWNPSQGLWGQTLLRLAPKTRNGFGLVTGQATGNKPSATGTSNLYKATGSFTLVVDYAARTATLKLTLLGDATGCTTCSPDINVTYDSSAGTLAAGVVTFTLPGAGSGKFFLAGGAVASGSTVAVAPTEVAGSFALTAADPNEAGVTMVVSGSGGGLR